MASSSSSLLRRLTGSLASLATRKQACGTSSSCLFAQAARFNSTTPCLRNAALLTKSSPSPCLTQSSSKLVRPLLVPRVDANRLVQRSFASQRRLRLEYVECVVIKRVLVGLDYVGTALFAFTGTMKAATVAQMDVLGCCLVGFTTAVGGGTVRDLITGTTPVFWLKQPQYIALAVASALATFFLYPKLRKEAITGLNLAEHEQELMNWADAIALGAFACVGAIHATQLRMHWLCVPVCGMVTATFGGIIRDLLCQQKPWIFHTDSGLYATTALGAATSFVITTHIVKLPAATGLIAGIGTMWWFTKYVYADEEEPEEDVEDEEEEEEEDPEDVRPQLEEFCKPKCVKAWVAYQECTDRVSKDTTGEAHCTGQYFDYWACIDHCVGPKLFKELK
ncbi:ubiquinol-cytochrome C reductase [Chloropicon primus]|uniref:Complex III subunit VI n=2 Tax=Chloropicon primus TaxID=1764295 RepID=A0A5B8MXG6_9CHLO|nr:ubiquinol-cytochrome C reductase [Chloropicon primus]|eukprot:QDZ25299.1 ubiquinol-cytochrome C reductase [Chloropicon primus]